MQTIFRVVFLYLFILLSLRVMGKREFSQLSPIELVALLLIPELASQALIGDDFSMATALTALCTLFVLVFIISLLEHKFKKVDTFLHDSPALLVAYGGLQEETLNKERITPDEIYAEMHKVGLERLDQVKWVILEGDGKLSIIPKNPSALKNRDELEKAL